MDEICRRLAVEKEQVVTAYSGAIYAERLDKANASAQVLAFPGIWVIGDRLKHRSGEWFDGDPNAGLVSSTVMNRAAKAALRMAGVRDILVVGHPVVTGLLDKLSIDRAHVPPPHDDIVAKLEKLKGFAIDGKIVTIDGVPVPASKEQADWFVVQRYRQLYAPGALPHLVYRRDPDNIAEADHAALGQGGEGGQTPSGQPGAIRAGTGSAKHRFAFVGLCGTPGASRHAEGSGVIRRRGSKPSALVCA